MSTLMLTGGEEPPAPEKTLRHTQELREAHAAV